MDFFTRLFRNPFFIWFLAGFAISGWVTAFSTAGAYFKVKNYVKVPATLSYSEKSEGKCQFVYDPLLIDMDVRNMMLMNDGPITMLYSQYTNYALIALVVFVSFDRTGNYAEFMPLQAVKDHVNYLLFVYN